MSYNCSYSIGDTGVDCFTLLKKSQKVYFVPYYNSLGVINSITLSSGTYTNTFFEGLINQADPSKRWYPSPLLRNAKNIRDASISKTYDDNSIMIIQKGVKKFTAIVAGEDGASPVILNSFLSTRKQKFGMFIVDIDGNLIGNGKIAGQLNPIMIDNNSMDPIYNQGEDKNPTELALNFNISSTENDTDLAALDAIVDIDPSATLLNYTGLLLVIPTVVSPANALVKIALNTQFGSAGTPTAVHGLVASDFNGVKVSGSGTYGTPSTVTEELDSNGQGTGVYDIAFSAPSATDVIKVVVTATGFDWIKQNNNPITLT